MERVPWRGHCGLNEGGGSGIGKEVGEVGSFLKEDTQHSRPW